MPCGSPQVACCSVSIALQYHKCVTVSIKIRLAPGNLSAGNHDFIFGAGGGKRKLAVGIRTSNHGTRWRKNFLGRI